MRREGFSKLLIMLTKNGDKKTEKELINFYQTEKKYFFQMEKSHGEKYYAPILGILKEKKISFEGKKILDVGSGTGTFVEVLKKVFGDSFEAVGVDISPISREFHRQKKIKFVITDANKLPFKNEAFDFVFSVDVFEHLLNPQLALLEMYRVTKKGGFILVRTRNYRSPLSTGSLSSVIKALKDLVKNKNGDLRKTGKLKPNLVTWGGDEDAVSEIFADRFRSSLGKLDGKILVLKTWTKDGLWEVLNLIPLVNLMGSMTLFLFKKA